MEELLGEDGRDSIKARSRVEVELLGKEKKFSRVTIIRKIVPANVDSTASRYRDQTAGG